MYLVSLYLVRTNLSKDKRKTKIQIYPGYTYYLIVLDAMSAASQTPLNGGEYAKSNIPI